MIELVNSFIKPVGDETADMDADDADGEDDKSGRSRRLTERSLSGRRVKRPDRFTEEVVLSDGGEEDEPIRMFS